MHLVGSPLNVSSTAIKLSFTCSGELRTVRGLKTGCTESARNSRGHAQSQQRKRYIYGKTRASAAYTQRVIFEHAQIVDTVPAHPKNLGQVNNTICVGLQANEPICVGLPDSAVFVLRGRIRSYTKGDLQ